MNTWGSRCSLILPNEHLGWPVKRLERDAILKARIDSDVLRRLLAEA